MRAAWRELHRNGPESEFPKGKVMLGSRYTTIHPMGNKWMIMFRPKTWDDPEVIIEFVDTEEEAKSAAEAYEKMKEV